MNRSLLIGLIILFSFKLTAQTHVLDSLSKLLNQPITDSLKGYVLDELSYQWFYNNLDTSLYYANQSVAVFKEINNLEGLARAYTGVAVAYHYKNEWDSAEVNYLKSKETNEVAGDSVGIAGSLNNLGVLLMDKGDFKSAADQFLVSLKIKESLGDSAGMASGNANLGLIFRKQGNYESAIQYYMTSLDILLKLGRLQNLPTIYINIGSLYNFKNDFEKGLKYNQLGLKASKELNSSRYIGESFINISDSYQGLNVLDSSLFYIKEAIGMFRSNDDNVNLGRALNSAAGLHLKKNEYQTALKYSLEVKELNKAGKLDLVVKNNFNLAQEYAGLSRMNLAYSALMDAYSAKDSLLNESLNDKIAELTAQFESEKKERKILELQRNQIEADLDLAESRNQRNVFVLIAMLVLGISILLFVLYRVKARSASTIAKSLDEKETLLKEIHHRVKNNLQVVSSLLSMQSRFITDESALGAVNEGQTRVESMALIHQKLYQENNLSGVQAKEYIEDLADILKQSYETDTEIEFAYDIEDLMIDVDTIIPIGLILNELICNSLKHAFPKAEEGIIQIGLKEEADILKLEIRDNGIGSASAPSEKSFGMVLIESLALKLKATLHIDTQDGTSVTLDIGKYKLV